MTSQAHPLRFYHGTHSRAATMILAEGLRPQAEPKSAMRGNLSTIPGYTERMVFLAPSIEEAAFYAREQAKHAGALPAIFEVIVWDEERVKVSDDYRQDQAIQAMLEFANLPPLEFDEDMDVDQNGISSDAYYFWRELLSYMVSEAGDSALERLTDYERESATEVMGPINVDALWDRMVSVFMDAQHHHWRASIATDRDPSVAYEGAISTSNLFLISEPRVKSALERIDRGAGNTVTWDLVPPAEHPCFAVDGSRESDLDDSDDEAGEIPQLAQVCG